MAELSEDDIRERHASVEPAIACSLSASELSTRVAHIGALGRDALIDARRDGSCAVLRFAATPGVRKQLDAIVAAEAKCCAFLAMTLADESDGLVLEILGPEGSELVVQDLVDAFRAEPQSSE